MGLIFLVRFLHALPGSGVSQRRTSQGATGGGEFWVLRAVSVPPVTHGAGLFQPVHEVGFDVFNVALPIFDAFPGFDHIAVVGL
jgi:hypothetical protein